MIRPPPWSTAGAGSFLARNTEIPKSRGDDLSATLFLKVGREKLLFAEGKDVPTIPWGMNV